MKASEVRRVRAALGLTQVELAQRLGVTPLTVSNWERGVHPCEGPSGVALASLAKADGPMLVGVKVPKSAVVNASSSSSYLLDGDVYSIPDSNTPHAKALRQYIFMAGAKKL